VPTRREEEGKTSRTGFAVSLRVNFTSSPEEQRVPTIGVRAPRGLFQHRPGKHEAEMSVGVSVLRKAERRGIERLDEADVGHAELSQCPSQLPTNREISGRLN
jgi:hypothetical protein